MTYILWILGYYLMWMLVTYLLSRFSDCDTADATGAGALWPLSGPIGLIIFVARLGNKHWRPR